MKLTKEQAREYLKDKYVPVRSEEEASQAVEKILSLGIAFADPLNIWAAFGYISKQPFEDGFGFYSWKSVENEAELPLSDLLAIEIIDTPDYKALYEETYGNLSDAKKDIQRLISERDLAQVNIADMGDELDSVKALYEEAVALLEKCSDLTPEYQTDYDTLHEVSSFLTKHKGK